MQKYAEESGAVKKKDEKLDWMYQGPGGMLNREDYLLGRPVDKYILDSMQEPESGPSSETGLLPGSIFTATGAHSALDLASKIREDPLFMIRKKEDEKKREVLKNPVKMKKIREMLKTSLEKESKKKKKEKKKRRKEKRQSSTSNEDSSEGEKERSRNRSHRRHNDSPSPPVRQKMTGYGLQVRDHDQDSRRVEEKNRARAHSRSPHSDRKGNRVKSDFSHGGHKRSPSPCKQEPYRRQRVSGYSKKLSAEELERRRLEMMEDARQREVERESNVRRYKQDDEREKEEKQKKESKFLHNMKLESAASSSVEDRVKRNIHGIQRTSAALEKNFMKR
ncbi:hypothetical protein GDO86_014129 [Hymenochirus boettgeri]|uniref:Uncharacterized protein n=2 Tax=Hymenochirus boettgeri TaxID=247094 RepID=A0A8T2JML8_9PIPI|nr:hypothetical protein GDO86_014129 [Hymenochirus boettgeri]